MQYSEAAVWNVKKKLYVYIFLDTKLFFARIYEIVCSKNWAKFSTDWFNTFQGIIHRIAQKELIVWKASLYIRLVPSMIITEKYEKKQLCQKCFI